MKILVAYFSATGTTRSVAQSVSKTLSADLYEIRPAVPYTSEDLNWNNKQSRSSVEMADPKSRPAIADTDAKIADYDVVFLGFPIWWYIAPTIVNTFLESYDFSGKTVILFATSGGSGFGKAVDSLAPSCDSSTVIREGKVFVGGASEADVASWLKDFKW